QEAKGGKGGAHQRADSHQRDDSQEQGGQCELGDEAGSGGSKMTDRTASPRYFADYWLSPFRQLPSVETPGPSQHLSLRFLLAVPEAANIGVRASGGQFRQPCSLSRSVCRRYTRSRVRGAHARSVRKEAGGLLACHHVPTMS